jgi:two-component system, NtrC family, response regulator HydG
MTLVEIDLEHMLTLQELERRYIDQVLRASNGNKAQAARTLGLDRRTLYRKMERMESGGSDES